MTLHAYHCTTCDEPIFRTVTHGRTGQLEFTHPVPESVFAWVQVGAQKSPGVGYCARHIPHIGDRGPTLPHGVSTVVGLDAAGLRHEDWYTPKFGKHLRAWLHDHCELPEHEVARVMDEWMDDCKAVEGVHA